MQENNQPKGKNSEPNNNPGNLKQDMAKNIGSKVASGAMQASGVPKPLADVAGKAASNMMGNHNPLKRGGFGPGLGPNGIGKSTFLNVLNSTLEPQAVFPYLHLLIL